MTAIFVMLICIKIIWSSSNLIDKFLFLHILSMKTKPVSSRNLITCSLFSSSLILYQLLVICYDSTQSAMSRHGSKNMDNRDVLAVQMLWQDLPSKFLETRGRVSKVLSMWREIEKTDEEWIMPKWSWQCRNLTGKQDEVARKKCKLVL